MRIAPDAFKTDRETFLAAQTEQESIAAEPSQLIRPTPLENMAELNESPEKPVKDNGDQTSANVKPNQFALKLKTIENLKKNKADELIVRKAETKPEASKLKTTLSSANKPKQELLNTAAKIKAENQPKSSLKTKGKT